MTKPGKPESSRNFFDLPMKKPFDEDIFMGKLITFYKDKRLSEMAGDRTDGTVSENPQGEPIVGKYLKRKRTANIMETEYDRY